MDPDPEATKTDTPEGDGPRPARRIGPYELLGELGHGGMGIVYLAARADEQYEKRVALKLIKGGLDRDEVVRGFRRERQILAGLEHPNIARLLDGGATDDGLPYFVMEYIEGQRIDEYCTAGNVSTVERLRLFRSVCSAIEYAHRNLIVHRDLKPGNILVTAEGVPKLLDFGIAKLVTPSVVETATATGLAMTPAYASPEQARGEPVTTASDVYSLGVVLYQLLTGQLPYRLRTLHPLDVLRAVCEEEPDKPSAAVARTEIAEVTEAFTLEGVGGTRHEARTPDLDRERLRRRLKGDLDTIVLTALRKEPARRYLSVEALSEDIRRYMEGLPIAARKPTFGYRAGKFLRRHWAGVASATAAALLIVGFSVSTFLQSARIARERDKAERVSSFLVDLFTVSDPGEARGNTVTAREILDKGAERIRGELEDEPEVRATLMHTMGKVFMELGLYDRAEALLRDALETRRRVLGEHPDVALTLHTLATVRYARGDYAGAEVLFREALSMKRRLLGNDHPEVAKTLNNLAIVLWEKGSYDGAEALYRESLAMRRKALGNEHVDVASSLHNLAMVLTDKGEYAEAESLKREALALERRLLGDEHPDVARTMHNLAVTLQAGGDEAGAESLYRESLAMRRRLLGNDHPEVADSLDGLARVLCDRGDPATAEGLFREALAIAEKALGKEHVVVAGLQAGLADALRDERRLAEAEAMYRSAVAMDRRLFPKQHPAAAAPLTGLGVMLVEKGDPLPAEPLLREALAIRRAALPKGHPDIAETESALGSCLAAQGRDAEAEPLLAGSYAVLKAKRSDRSRAARDAQARLVKLHGVSGKPAR